MNAFANKKHTPPLVPPLSKQSPIGVFDSGVGGLSVYLHLRQALPNERYLYYADTKHVPYGSRDGDDIRHLTLSAVQWLYQQGCKLIVIACNSASAYALTCARAYYPQLPIVGLVPALKPAVLASESHHVAVLATRATLEGALLNQVIEDIATPAHTTVSKWFDPALVPWVEAGMPTDSHTAKRLLEQLTQFAQAGVDHIVLGCTHYPFFRDYIEEKIAENDWEIKVIDSGSAIAARVAALLKQSQLLADTSHDEPLRLYASKYDEPLKTLVERLVYTPLEMVDVLNQPIQPNSAVRSHALLH